jgi:hypothetical protein
MPVDCSDARCSEPGFTCGIIIDPFCCGDGFCDPGEDSCSCGTDCGPPPTLEAVCDDGADDDCDGDTDCQDIDCCADALCDDGVDSDNDGVTGCDCDDGNNEVWFTPTEIVDLTLPSNDASGAVLQWSAPVEPGALSWSYDVLRSSSSDDFTGAACLVQDDPLSPMAVDEEIPLSLEVYHYLVRAKNACPSTTGEGSLGTSSSGGERSGASCP